MINEAFSSRSHIWHWASDHLFMHWKWSYICMSTVDLEHYCMFCHKVKRLCSRLLFSLTWMPLYDVLWIVVYSMKRITPHIKRWLDFKLFCSMFIQNRANEPNEFEYNISEFVISLNLGLMYNGICSCSHLSDRLCSRLPFHDYVGKRGTREKQICQLKLIVWCLKE